MPASYDLSVEVVVNEPPVDSHALFELAERVMAGEDIPGGTGLSVLITGDDEIRDMNRRFLGIDEPTDVLSFPDEAGDFVQGIAEEAYLGDIAISLPTAVRQAEDGGHSLDAEVAHLLVHGILHLCGYEHEQGGEPERLMREREEHYLGDVAHGH
ncbi:MAG: rRNA maturation RNase YbeY [Dehalococcoidia bacterium]|nr:rRNA maturation RNase YbeY [Dehalococcoidia bacterium]